MNSRGASARRNLPPIGLVLLTCILNQVFVRTPPQLRETGDEPNGAGTRRPDQTPGVAQGPPIRAGRHERPTAVGGPGGRPLLCHARLRNRLRRPDGPWFHPLYPAAGAVRLAVRGADATRTALGRIDHSRAGRHPSPGALERVRARPPRVP